MSVFLVVLRKVLSILLGALAKALLTERVIIELMIKFGDWLVKKTGNDLDDKLWLPLKAQLLKNLTPGK